MNKSKACREDRQIVVNAVQMHYIYPNCHLYVCYRYTTKFYEMLMHIENLWCSHWQRSLKMHALKLISYIPKCTHSHAYTKIMNKKWWVCKNTQFLKKSQHDFKLQMQDNTELFYYIWYAHYRFNNLGWLHII